MMMTMLDLFRRYVYNKEFHILFKKTFGGSILYILMVNRYQFTYHNQINMY